MIIFVHFVHKHPETYVHLFVMCELIRPIWIKIERFMYQFDDTDIDFNIVNVIANLLTPSSRKNVKNFICLLFKQYLYRQRCLQKTPNFNQFQRIVWQTKNIERFIAVKNNKESHYIKKWNRNETSLSYFDLYDCDNTA